MTANKKSRCISSIKSESEINDLALELEKCISIGQAKSYLLSYDGFVEHFKDAAHSDLKHIVASIFMVYGWMPTIPNIFKEINSDHRSYTIEDLPEVVRTIKKITDETSEKDILTLIENLKPLVNNSLVGTSKFLHFINPEIFPIWDSKVANNMYGYKTNYQFEKLENYKHYFLWIKCLRQSVNPKLKKQLSNQVKEAIERQVGISVNTPSFTRVVELLCFYGLINHK